MDLLPVLYEFVGTFVCNYPRILTNSLRVTILKGAPDITPELIVVTSQDLARYAS